MTSLKPYSEYKDSGVEWLGDVPSHWDAVPLRYGMQFLNGMAFKPTDWGETGTPIIRIQNLNDGEAFNYFDGQFPTKYLVESGDLLFGWSGNRGTSFGPFQWNRGGKFVLNQHIFKLVDVSYSRRWLYFALKAVTKTIEDQAHGIIGMVHITKDKLGGIRIPVPTTDEQTTIANFLDRETARIDALIEKKERQITLLEEKRQAVITQAVTKGLDPDVPMKDSGIEWLGDVPEHWDILQISKTLMSSDYGISESLDDEGNVAILRMGNIQAGEVVLDKLGYVESVPSELLVFPGDVLFNRTNSLDLVGKTGIFRGGYAHPLSLASYLVRFRFKASTNPEFMNFFMNMPAVMEYARSLAFPSISQANLNPNRYGYIKLALPDRKEQDKIVGHLNSACEKIIRLIKLINDSKSALKERRAALITAAVTGQIDVREAA